MDYVDADHNKTPISVQVRATFDLNMDTSGSWPITFTGAGPVTHTRLDVSDFQKILQPQCTVTLTANDGSMVARIRYSAGGDPLLEFGNTGSILETLALGGYCVVGGTRNIWGGPFAILHQSEMIGPGYYEFSMSNWTQVGPATSDGPVTFFKDYNQSTSSMGNEDLAPLMPVNGVRETTHVEFTIYARSPVNQPTNPGRRRSVRH